MAQGAISPRMILFVCFLSAFIGFLSGCSTDSSKAGSLRPVGTSTNGELVLPISQRVKPVGVQIHLPKARPQVLALSPDGKYLATSGKTHELYIIDPVQGKRIQTVMLPSEELNPVANPEAVSTHILKPDTEGQASFTGLVFSPDGKQIFLSNVNGSIKVFQLIGDQWKPQKTLPLPKVRLAKTHGEIPSGLAFSEDGKNLYVVANLSNKLLELDPDTGIIRREFQVGMAPYTVVLANNKAFVSNWGGRRPGTNDLTGPGGRGTTVRVDPIRHIASEGSVSIIDLRSGATHELVTGKHCSGLAVSPNAKYVVTANAADDSLSVLDAATGQIVETISVHRQKDDPFGASPNALTFDPTGEKLYVCNGTQNAVAVIAFKPANSKVTGLIPTGWFPGAIVFDPNLNSIYVANIKGLGPGEPYGNEGKVRFSSHQYFGSISLIKVPSPTELKGMTEAVHDYYGREAMLAGRLPPRPGQPPRPIPERAGEPSVFNHVVYIIKENRTYDQVFGDLPQGNGAPDLCVFGEKFTPNQHKMVREFVLLDNTYCSGILSADGHQWADSAISTDYMEKSFAGFPRSYPDGMEESDVDAMAYSPAGFIWDNVLAHGKTLRDYGEFTIGHVRWKDPAQSKSPRFIDIYRDFINQTGLIEIGSKPAIASLTGLIMTNTIGWDMNVPDVFRAAQFIKDLREFERVGRMPNFIIICLPNDHTSGTRANSPTPGAQVADNDLAFGRIVEAISHSRFWKDTCIFAIEDDPQAGWDHVSGYRTTAYVISPYTKRGAVIHENYNQVTMVRTMELILGLSAMHQLDAAAPSMAACFTSVPDFTPFVSVPNNVPLDELNPDPKAIVDPVRRAFALASARLPLAEPDKCSEDLLNRIIWNAQRGSHAMYPSWALTHVEDDDD